MKIIRKILRNFFAMQIRYYRWRSNPNNAEYVAMMDAYKIKFDNF